jgi:hypothetical protein
MRSSSAAANTTAHRSIGVSPPHEKTVPRQVSPGITVIMLIFIVFQYTTDTWSPPDEPQLQTRLCFTVYIADGLAATSITRYGNLFDSPGIDKRLQSMRQTGEPGHPKNYL